jgi:hypothetical protein
VSVVARGAFQQYRSDVVAGEQTVIMADRCEKFDGTSPVILYCHGATHTATEIQTFFEDSYDETGVVSHPSFTLPQLLAEQGFIICSSLWGSATNWGNASSVTKMQEAVTWLGSNGADVSRLGLWGVSMGFMTASNYWNAHQSAVEVVFGQVPVCNASNIYTDNVSLQAGMNAAYSGSFATNGASRSPHLILPGITGAGAKLRLHYSSADVVTRSADAAALVSALGATGIDVEPAVPSGHGSWLSSTQDEQVILEHFAVLQA